MTSSLYSFTFASEHDRRNNEKMKIAASFLMCLLFSQTDDKSTEKKLFEKIFINFAARLNTGTIVSDNQLDSK